MPPYILLENIFRSCIKFLYEGRVTLVLLYSIGFSMYSMPILRLNLSTCKWSFVEYFSRLKSGVDVFIQPDHTPIWESGLELKTKVGLNKGLHIVKAILIQDGVVGTTAILLECYKIFLSKTIFSLFEKQCKAWAISTRNKLEINWKEYLTYNEDASALTRKINIRGR